MPVHRSVRPKEVMRSFIEGYQEGRRPEVFDECVSPDFIDHSPTPGLTPGAEGVRQLFQMLWSALPDMRVEVHQQVEEGEMLATRKSFLGTQQGALFGVPTTGKKIQIDIFDLVRVRDGRIVEHWNLTDSYGLMQQLGAIAS